MLASQPTDWSLAQLLIANTEYYENAAPQHTIYLQR